MKRSIKLISALTALLAGAGQVNAATYATTADTTVYQFLGNLPAQGLLTWNHTGGHAAKALLDFNSLDSSLSSLTAGGFSATLNLYVSCTKGGFVGGCPGDPLAGGAATVTTDIFTQNGAWTENGTINWSNIVEGTKVGTFSQNSNTAGWLSINVTSLVELWRQQGSTGDGIVLSEGAYPVVRNDAGSLVVASFLDKEASGGLYASYIDVQAVPVPAAAWLFGSAVLGLGGISRRRQTAA